MISIIKSNNSTIDFAFSRLLCNLLLNMQKKKENARKYETLSF